MNKKLLFVVDNLVMGGVTRVLFNLLKNLDGSKYDIDLLVLHYCSESSLNQIPEGVRLIKGDKLYEYIDRPLAEIIKNRDIKGLIKKIALFLTIKNGKIKVEIKKSRKKILSCVYDTEIAFNDGFTQIFTANGDSKRKIAWLHADISMFNDSARYVKRIKESLDAFDAFVCVSKKVREAYEGQFEIKNAVVIHNIMDEKRIISNSKKEIENVFDNDRVNLISVGRLCEAKNYSRFIRVHKRLIDDGYPINSYIIGDGPDREQLVNEIAANNVEQSFKLLGRKENPFPYVKNADVFVLSSNHEGLPTVLYEALILNVPCVSTGVAGVEEILGEDYGIITENSEEALYRGIKQMLTKDKYKKYKEIVSKYCFAVNDIIHKVEDIL